MIYISNTRIPSEKANTYQSMVMCEAFAKNGCNVEFWYPNMRNSYAMQQIDDVYQFYGVKKNFHISKIGCLDSTLLYKFSFYKIWFLLRSFTFASMYIFKLVKKQNVDFIFTRDVIGLFIFAKLKKYFSFKHQIYFEAHEYSQSISKNIKYIDGLVVINNYLKTLYEQDGIKNVLIAHDGVKLEEYRQLESKKKTEVKNIVYVGNLFEWKGVYTLVDSIKYLDNIILTIVGGSNDTLPKFKNYIEEKKIKNINLIGFVKKEDTIKYIQEADVLVLPNSAKDKMSYYTSPLKLFEYMASKRVIVASKLPSIEEVLEDGKNAILFEPDNPRDLAKKIQWCLQNDTNIIVQQAYTDVQEYTWDKRAKKILNWIEDARKYN